MSRICEEFHCLPSQAVDEPLGLCLTIMDDRAYVRAKEQVDRADAEGKAGELPDDPMIALVVDIQFDIAREAKRR